VRGSRLDELDRADACLDPCDPRLRVDLDPAHALGLDEDGVVERPDGAASWPVPCAASRSPKALASSTAAATSSADSGKTTAVGL
jgi:hypothetical protein